jgi:hypothetical protein
MSGIELSENRLTTTLQILVRYEFSIFGKEINIARKIGDVYMAHQIESIRFNFASDFREIGVNILS